MPTLLLACNLFGLTLVAERTGRCEPVRSAPNVVLILADDLGFSDVGCYGGEIATPNLDRLARQGLRFTQFYNTARCWPSRACIMTGYYAQAVRRDSLPSGSGGALGVRPRWARLLPDLLKPLGYRSYHSGKWHIDGNPLANGFERSYRIDGAGFDNHFKPGATVDGRPAPEKGDSYAATAAADHAIDCLREHAEKHADRPFFTYLAFIEPHFPLQAKAEDIALYRDAYQAGWDEIRTRRHARMLKMGLLDCGLSRLDPKIWPDWNLPEAALQQRLGPGEVGRAVAWESLSAEQKAFQAMKMSIHAAMVHRIDVEVGRVVDQLKAMGALENTLIFFLSDNGASAEQIIRGGGHDRNAAPGSAKSYLCLGPGWSSAANAPLRLHKSWTHEGGIATPLIVHWPAGIKAHGELRRNPGHVIDLPPTILELAGGRWPATLDSQPVPAPHGKSLTPVFTQDGPPRHEYLWWCHGGNRAIRVGDWKIAARKNTPWELYDLSRDRCESTDLAAANPEKVRELEVEWNRHAEQFRTLAREDGAKEPTGKPRRGRRPEPK